MNRCYICKSEYIDFVSKIAENKNGDLVYKSICGKCTEIINEYMDTLRYERLKDSCISKSEYRRRKIQEKNYDR